MGFYAISLKVEVHIKHLRKVGWSQQWLKYELASDKDTGLAGEDGNRAVVMPSRVISTN